MGFRVFFLAIGSFLKEDLMAQKDTTGLHCSDLNGDGVHYNLRLFVNGYCNEV